MLTTIDIDSNILVKGRMLLKLQLHKLEDFDMKERMFLQNY